MKDFSLTDLYQIGRNAVRLFPDQSLKCLQPQTFRVLQLSEEKDLVGTSNLGIVPTDKDTPFFWAREWMQKRYPAGALTFEFPLFTMNEVGYTDTGRFGGNGFSRVYRINIHSLKQKRV